MDNPFVQPKVPIQRLMFLIVAVILAIALSCMGLYLYRVSDPYIHNVLSLEGDSQRGHDIFQINCAACHGLSGNGKVGPSLHHIAKRKSQLGLIHQVTSGETPPMPMFQPNPQAMADLLEYLRSL